MIWNFCRIGVNDKKKDHQVKTDESGLSGHWQTGLPRCQAASRHTRPYERSRVNGEMEGL